MLTDAKIRGLKPRETRYKVADRDGLYLEVRPNGNKSWLLRVSGKDGKRSWLGVGKYPLYGLADARAKALEMARGEAGLAPVAVKVTTFKSCAEEFCPKMEQSGTSQQTVNAFYRLLELHVYPVIGDKDISTLASKDIYDIVDRLERMGNVITATKIIQHCSRIFRFGILKEYCQSDPCYALRGAVKKPPVQHYSTLTEPSEIRELMDKISKMDDARHRTLLQFSAYTFCRPSEIRCATWDEIDVGKGVWVIPAERMKANREHMVPITRQLAEVLNELRFISGGSRWLFPSNYVPENNKPTSSTTASNALRSIGYTGRMTPHGFRGMASTTLNENGFNYDWIEVQLAHVPSNKVRGAYNRAQYWDGRVDMCQWYADYLDGMVEGRA